jgi:hypothetical protein
MIEMLDNIWLRFKGLKYIKETDSNWRYCYVNVGTFFKPIWVKHFPLYYATSRNGAIETCKLAMLSYKKELEFYKSNKKIDLNMTTQEFHKYLIEKAK